MGQPVKLSDALILDARIAAEAQQRSIAGQVEFWARLGKSIEPLLDGRRVLKLLLDGEARPLSELLNSVETPESKARAKAYVESLPFPHYRQVPGQYRTYIRTEADGTETVGRFTDQAFVSIDPDSAVNQGSETNAAEFARVQTSRTA
jgi:hypothetical protein